jgi:ubiquinone/menaquinone biosynthesis C-methylase UbiE
VTTPRGDGEEWVAQTRRDARRYWDAHPIAVDTSSHERGTRASFDELYERLCAGMDENSRRFLEQCRGKRVLEMGCGIGLHGRFLASNGIDYTGVDYSRRSLELAREHFRQNGLRARFVNADGTALPFADGSFDLVFSDGVVHHIPDMPSACRELVRVARPGGDVRVMVYSRDSYHYALVRFVICPLIWCLVRVPGLAALARFLPQKVRRLYEIARDHGYEPQRILDASTDTSSSGEGNWNPLSYFLTPPELAALFPSLEAKAFRRKMLRGFPPLPGRVAVERRFGFFLTLTGRKPSA